VKINEVNAPLFRSEKELQDERVKKVFFDKITSQLTNGLEKQISAGVVTATPAAAPADPFAAKRAQAAAAARANMASNPAPAAAPADQFAAQRSQSAAAARANMASNPAPVAKPSAPIATAPKKPWKASGPRSPEVAAKMQRTGFRENKFYQAVNAVFESIINIDEAQPTTTGPISISDYIEQAFVHFMNNDVFKTPVMSQLIVPLAKKVEDTYATDKGKAAIQELVDFGYTTLYKLKNSKGTAVPNNRNTANTGNTQNAETSKFGQAISIIDQLSPKQKKKISAYINNELNPTAAAPNNEKVSIGGQEIKPGDPLYDKIKGNLG
jgi:hypothetical protein